MKKILFGIMGLAMTLAMTLAVVGGTAFALFSDSATISGISINAGSVGLLVNGEENFNADLNISGIYPGWGGDDNESAQFTLTNDSSADFALSITGQLTAANGWNSSALKDWFEIKVKDEATGEMSEWYSLSEWNSEARDFPGPALGADETRTYIVYARLPDGAPDSLEGASLSGIEFTIVGTQEGEESTPTPSPTTSATPSPTPTATPTPTPDVTPTPEPTVEPTATPTPNPEI